MDFFNESLTRSYGWIGKAWRRQPKSNQSCRQVRSEFLQVNGFHDHAGQVRIRPVDCSKACRTSDCIHRLAELVNMLRFDGRPRRARGLIGWRAQRLIRKDDRLRRAGNRRHED
jgi:hypothetical protein